MPPFHVFGKLAQLLFRNSKLRSTTIQADSKLGGYIDVRLIEVFQPGEVNGNLSAELVQVL